jgi:hypothetical protein
VDAAVDNDIICKAACYGLVSRFWPGLGDTSRVGILGTARYVVPKAIDRRKLNDGVSAHDEFRALVEAADVIEPTEEEVGLAAEIELRAQEAGLPLDAGESQLIAVTVMRSLPILESGDKRAVQGVEQLLGSVDRLEVICGRVRCLEQIVLRLVTEDRTIDLLRGVICDARQVDMTLSICFSCAGEEVPEVESVLEGLRSYISALRSCAPRILADD